VARMLSRTLGVGVLLMVFHRGIRVYNLSFHAITIFLWKTTEKTAVRN